jgi:hypothetical protein
LRRIEPKIVENISFGGIEHPKGAANYSIFCRRPSEPETGPPIPFIESHAGVGNGAGTIRGTHNGFVEVEVSNAPIRGRSDFVAQTKIDGQLLIYPEVILEEPRQIPIPRWIKTGEEILLVRDGRAKQEIGYTVASIGGSQVHRVGTGKVEVSARARELKEVALLAPEINAELERMLAFNPGRRVSYLVDVFEDVLRQPLRIA